MADKEPVRTKSRAGGSGTGRRMVIGGCTLLAGAVAGLVAYLYRGGPAPGPLLHPPASSPVIALGVVGLVCYTMFFLVCEAALLVLAIINIQHEKVHNKYRSLMLLVLYVFTFRYRRVLPAKFFAGAGTDACTEAAKRAPVAGGPRNAGKHRRRRRERPACPEPSPSVISPLPVTDEELRAAFTVLLTRMATVLGDKETAARRAVADLPSHPHE